MDNLMYDSTSEQLPNSSALQAHSQNHPSESNDVVIPIRDDEEEDQRPPPFLTLATQSLRFHDLHGMFYLVYAGLIVIMYPSLEELVQLKFQGKKSPFETHAFLANTSAVAYFIAIPSSVLSFYMRGRLNSTIKERFYMILKIVFFFSGILSPLSLGLLLVVPHGYTWIGYPIIFVLFVIIVGCNFGSYIKSCFLRKMYPTWEQFKRMIEKLFSTKDDVPKLEAVQRDYSSPHSVVNISG